MPNAIPAAFFISVAWRSCSSQKNILSLGKFLSLPGGDMRFSEKMTEKKYNQSKFLFIPMVLSCKRVNRIHWN